MSTQRQFDGSTLPALNDLLQAMSQGSSTNNWDCVISYSLAALNAALKARYDSKAAVSEVKGTQPRTDPLTGKSFTLSYDVLLGAPEMEFISGTNGLVQLTMPILSGSYSVTPQGGTALPTVEIPSDYNVQVILPLVAVSGDGQQTAAAGTVLNFDNSSIVAGMPEVGNLRLHFKTTITTDWTIKLAPSAIEKLPDEAFDQVETFFLPVLREYFQYDVDEAAYTITSVSTANVPGSDRTAQVLIPLSFVFATSGQGTAAVLSIYVQIWNTGNPVGNLVPAFQPGGAQIAPLPLGYDASLIVSKNAFQDYLLTRTLQSSNFSNVSSSTAASGAAVSAHYIKSVSYGYSDMFTLNPFTLDFSVNPVTFSFATQTLTVSQTTAADSAWYTEMAGGSERVYSVGAGAHITVTVNRQFSLPQITQMSDASTLITPQLAASDVQVVVELYYRSEYDSSGYIPIFENAIAEKVGALLPPVVFDFTGLNALFLEKMLLPTNVDLRLANEAPNVPADYMMLASLSNVK
jgi:hypothetical protein